jgi:hypothetical protein
LGRLVTHPLQLFLQGEEDCASCAFSSATSVPIPIFLRVHKQQHINFVHPYNKTMGGEGIPVGIRFQDYADFYPHGQGF